MGKTPATEKAEDFGGSFRAVRRVFMLTRAGMIIECATRAFWPAFTIVMAGYAMLAFWPIAFAAYLPQLQLALIALLAIALGLGMQRFCWPTRQEAMSRMDNCLRDRPFASLADHLSSGQSSEMSVTIWNAHQARMKRTSELARAVPPDLRISNLDRNALRYVAATAFLLALAFAPFPAVDQDMKGPKLSGTPAWHGPEFDAWLEPPSYTNEPAVHLDDTVAGKTLRILEGSMVMVRLYGESNRNSVEESISGNSGPIDLTESRATIKASVSGDLRIGSDEHGWTTWTFQAVPDFPPTVRIQEPVEQNASGRLSFDLQLADDYGVSDVTVAIEPDYARIPLVHGLKAGPDWQDGNVFRVPIPFAGNRRGFTTRFSADFSRHALAGLPARVVVSAHDSGGQASSETLELERLPSRNFMNETAAALAEQSRDLVWSAENAMRVALIVSEITFRPNELFDNASAYLFSRSAMRTLESAGLTLAESRRREAVELLWQAAMALEVGQLASSRERMLKASELLAEAIRDGAAEEEIRQLLENQRRAVADFLREVARNAEELAANGEALPNDPHSSMHLQQIDESRIADFLEEIDRLLEEGRTGEAARRLEELRNILENVVATRMKSGEEASRMQQSMQGFGGTLLQQQALADQAFRQLEERRVQSGAGVSEGNQGSSGGLGSGQDHFGQGRGSTASDTGGNDLANRQEALRRQFRKQMQDFEDIGFNDRQAIDRFENAARAMTRARESLRSGNLERALQAQHEAIASLGEGIRELEIRSLESGGSSYGGPPGSGQTESDPLGRRLDGGSMPGLGYIEVPDEYSGQRSRKLRDEIRRRAGEAGRSAKERDYLEKLLKRF